MAEQKESDDHDVYVHMPGGDDTSATTMPCNPCVKYQARISAFLRPGHWIPCLRDCHAYSTAGCFKSESKTKGSEYVNAIRDAMEQCKLIVYQSKPTPYGFLIEAYDFTECCGWLDIVILQVYWDDTAPSDVKLEAFAGSTGVLPLAIPLAPILNCVLCWLPFLDHGRSKKTLDDLFGCLKF